MNKRKVVQQRVEVFRTNCNRCRGTTVHDVLASSESDLRDLVNPANPTEEIVGMELRMIVMCQGCGSRSFAHYIDDYRSGDRTTNYPPRIVRRAPDWYLAALLNTEFDVVETYGEVLDAVNSGSLRLAAMGIRAAIEAIMIHKVGDQGSFKSHINEFVIAGYLSKRDATAVMKVLEVGHAAIHRSHLPTQQDVERMLDILEHVMCGVFVNEDAASALNEPPPRRTRSRKAGTSTD